MEEGGVKKKKEKKEGEKERDETTDSRCGSHRGFLSNNIQKRCTRVFTVFPKLMLATKASRLAPISYTRVRSCTRLHAH